MKKKKKMKHWITQRWTALLGLITVVLGITLNPSFFFITMILVAMHAEQGLSSIIMDYVHSLPVRKTSLKIVFYLLVLTTFFWFSQINEFIPNVINPALFDAYVGWVDSSLTTLKETLLHLLSK